MRSILLCGFVWACADGGGDGDGDDSEGGQTALDADQDGFVPPEDCNDADSSMWRLMTVWADADGDAVGAGRGTVTCVGNAAAAGFSLLGYDPLDDPANPSSPGTSTVELAAWQLTPRL